MAIAPLTLDQIWWRPNDASNSIGNLMLHLAGNVRQWIVGGVGRQSMTRDRDLEFSTREPRSVEDLTAILRSALDDACAIIDLVTRSVRRHARAAVLVLQRRRRIDICRPASRQHHRDERDYCEPRGHADNHRRIHRLHAIENGRQNFAQPNEPGKAQG
jgi:hypothetical protein